MSRIGKKPVIIPANVTVTIADGNVVTVKGPKGTLTHTFHPDMILKIEGNELIVDRPDDEHLHKSLHGLTRTLIHNMVEGVEKGFTKELEVNGVGYRAEKKGSQLVMRLGFSHESPASPLRFPLPTRSSSTASTSRPLVSSPPRSGASVPPNPTRARASSIPLRSSAARLVRPVARSNGGVPKWLARSIRKQCACIGMSAFVARSPALLSVPV